MPARRRFGVGPDGVVDILKDETGRRWFDRRARNTGRASPGPTDRDGPRADGGWSARPENAADSSPVRDVAVGDLSQATRGNSLVRSCEYGSRGERGSLPRH